MSAIQQLPPTSSPRLHPLRQMASTPKGANANAVLACIYLGGALTIGLWWYDTPSISGLGDWLTNAGRITGLGAGYAIVVLLALMARVPAIERGVGADRLAKWHSRGGRYTVSLVVAHALLITWGYALTDHHNVVGEVWVLWTQYADVLMASVAGLLLVGVGVASARAARKRLQYETWLFIHFYTYLATALAFSHQFATGADFVDNLPARIVWSLLYAGVAVVLVWYRVITPVRNALSLNLRVADVIEENANVTSVIVSGKNLDRLATEPGQFFRWRFLTRNLWWTANPYSISALPRDHYLRITVKHLGQQSAALRRLRVGARVVAEGPYGAMTSARAKHRKVLLIGGGVGITPLRGLFERFSAERGSDVTLIYRAGSDGDVLFRRELDQIADHFGSHVIYALGRRGTEGDIVRTGVLERYAPDLRSTSVYICGPEGLTTQATHALKSAGVKARHIHHEDFSF